MSIHNLIFLNVYVTEIGDRVRGQIVMNKVRQTLLQLETEFCKLSMKLQITTNKNKLFPAKYIKRFKKKFVYLNLIDYFTRFIGHIIKTDTNYQQLVVS